MENASPLTKVIAFILRLSSRVYTSNYIWRARQRRLAASRATESSSTDAGQQAAARSPELFLKMCCNGTIPHQADMVSIPSLDSVRCQYFINNTPNPMRMSLQVVVYSHDNQSQSAFFNV